MKKTLLLSSMLVTFLAGCDAVLTDSESQTESTVYTFGIHDETLEACYLSAVKSNGWINIEQVTELTCDSGETIETLDGIENLTALTQLSVASLPTLSEADLADLAKLPALSQLSLPDDLVVSCEFKAQIDETLANTNISATGCYEVPYVIDQVTDAGLNACIQDTVDTNDWRLIEDVTQVSCAADYVVESLQGLEIFTAIADLEIANYPLLNSDDIGVMAQLSSISSLGFGDDLLLSCAAEANLKSQLPTNVTYDLPDCVEIPAALELLEDDNLRACIDQVATTNGWTKFAQLTTLSCGADYDITSLKELDRFTGIADLTLTGYQAFNESDVATLNNMAALTNLDVSGELIIDCDDEDALLASLDPINMTLPACQLNEVKAAIAEVTDANLNACLTEQVGDAVLLEQVTTLACHGSLGNNYSNKNPISVDAGVASLAGLGKFTSLTSLNVSFNMSITGGAELASLTKLKNLDLEFTRVNDEIIAALSNMPELEILNVNFTEIRDSDAFYEASKNWPNMIEFYGRGMGSESFNVSNLNNVLDGKLNDLYFLANFPNVEVVYLGNSLVTSGMPVFKDLPKVNNVYLWRSDLDASLGAETSPIELMVMPAGSNYPIDLNYNGSIDCAVAIQVAEHVSGLPYTNASWNQGEVKLPGACKP